MKQAPLTLGICPPESEFLILGDQAGYVKMISLDDNTDNAVKSFGQLHKGEIKSMFLSYDRKFFFTTADDRRLLQWDVATQQLIHDWGEKCHRGTILSILITSGRDQCLKRWNINPDYIMKDFGEIHEDWIQCMVEDTSSQF
jgi:WD40 repeat protein